MEEDFSTGKDNNRLQPREQEKGAFGGAGDTLSRVKGALQDGCTGALCPGATILERTLNSQQLLTHRLFCPPMYCRVFHRVNNTPPEAFKRES